MSTVLLKKEDIHRGNLILVNREHCFLDIGTEGLLPVYDREPGILLRHRAVVLLTNLMEEIKGWRQIVPVSGFRSREEQQQIWDNSLAESGREFTEKFVAFPGCSEHQTGLAIDLGEKKDKIDFICPEFPYSGICQIFRERAADYGFVERYPAGKEHITGIGHEPWHFRYVGAPHAALMQEKGLVLEEYVEFLRQYAYGDKPYRYERNGQAVEISWLAGGTGEIELDIDVKKPYSISGNNVDGYILAQWITTHRSAQNACGERRIGA